MDDRYGFDPYAVLGVERDAALAEIKVRYRALLEIRSRSQLARAL